MKILLATSKAIPSGGGIASYNQELVNLFGKDNDIYLLTDSDEHNVCGYNDTLSTFNHSNLDYGYCSQLIQRINSQKYDCIINSASAFIPVIAPFLNANIVSVSHFVNGPLAINAGFNAKYQSGIIALSNYGKSFILDKFKITHPEKIHVVYNFVQTSGKTVDPEKLKRQHIRIVYPGGTSIQKSVDVVQQLMYRLLNSNIDFEFIWLGGIRLPSSKMTVLGLHSTTDLFKKDSRLKIKGLIPRSEAENIIASANIFLLPSRGEGCPMTLLEAMRGGCISVISDACHGSREIIEQSGCGFIVRQDSSIQLFNTIKDIIDNHNSYSYIYDKSLQYLYDNLSQKEWSKQMSDILINAANTERLTIELNIENFKKSAKTFLRYNKWERYKIMLRSAFYRIKFDISFIKNKLGWYNAH